MKLLLDEHLPKQLKNDLADFEVFTVQDMDGMVKKWGTSRTKDLEAFPLTTFEQSPFQPTNSNLCAANNFPSSWFASSRNRDTQRTSRKSQHN